MPLILKFARMIAYAVAQRLAPADRDWIRPVGPRLAETKHARFLHSQDESASPFQFVVSPTFSQPWLSLTGKTRYTSIVWV
jgi:hypothetical protein